jgi:hypothetical protein
MSNQLNMVEHQSILGLARLNWSYRRIAAELGVDRQTVSRHMRAAAVDPLAVDCSAPNATISIAGSAHQSAGGIAPAKDSNATIVIAGSPPIHVLPGRQSRCESLRAIITQSLEQGLTARRIWQDLKADHDFDGDYQTVQRFVRKLHHATPLAFRRMECNAGEVAQVDFGKGAPVKTADGKRSRPTCFASC